MNNLLWIFWMPISIDIYLDGFGELWLIILFLLMQAVFFNFCYKRKKFLLLLGAFAPLLVLFETAISIYGFTLWYSDNYIPSSINIMHQVGAGLLLFGYWCCVLQLLEEQSTSIHYYNRKKFGGFVTVYRGNLFYNLKCFSEGHQWYYDYNLSTNGICSYRCLQCDKQIDTDRSALENVLRYYDIDD